MCGCQFKYIPYTFEKGLKSQSGTRPKDTTTYDVIVLPVEKKKIKSQYLRTPLKGIILTKQKKFISIIKILDGA